MADNAKSLHDHLKAATKCAHQRAEVAMDLPSRLETPATYGRLLVSLLPIHTAFECRVSLLATQNLSACNAMTADRLVKRDWLKADMEFLGSSKTSQANPDFSWIETSADVLGSMYVFEGATLGGCIIYREVERVFGFSANAGARFFHGYGKETKEHWAAFLAVLSEYQSRSEFSSSVVVAALRTFEVFERHLRFTHSRATMSIGE